MITIVIGMALYGLGWFCFYKAGRHGGKAAVYQEWADWERAHRP